MSPFKRARGSVATLMAPLLLAGTLNAAPALSATTPAAPPATPEEEQQKLNTLCSVRNLQSRQGQIDCLRETVRQSHALSNTLSNAWMSRVRPYSRDWRRAGNYGNKCAPQELYSLSPETGIRLMEQEGASSEVLYGLSRECLKHSYAEAKRLDLKDIQAESLRLLTQIYKNQAFYKDYPYIPPDPNVEAGPPVPVPDAPSPEAAPPEEKPPLKIGPNMRFA